MSEWQIVHGSQEIQPEEFDLTSSSVVGYQRKNIKKLEDGTWEYEERVLPKEECAKILQEETYKSSLTGLLALADLYEQLIEKKVL